MSPVVGRMSATKRWKNKKTMKVISNLRLLTANKNVIAIPRSQECQAKGKERLIKPKDEK